MGHGCSKDSSPSSSPHGRRAKLQQKLRRVVRRDSRSKGSGNGFKLVSADDFTGIALLTLISLSHDYGAGGKEIMQKLSEKQGEKMNSVDSTKEIPKFIELFKDQLNLSDMKYPLNHFKTFNEFFIRELKPGVRPIAFMDRDDTAVCAADSRLMAVNPIAVNSLCDVFTENKRAVSIISTAYFGKVAFVAIGATMVGSITFTREKGDYVQKGEEFGYFSFGGSTVICVFEKDVIKMDEDLLDNSTRSLETLVRVGMTVGVSTKTKQQ